LELVGRPCLFSRDHSLITDNVAGHPLDPPPERVVAGACHSAHIHVVGQRGSRLRRMQVKVALSKPSIRSSTALSGSKQGIAG
jgi:hypothetical protein